MSVPSELCRRFRLWKIWFDSRSRGELHPGHRLVFSNSTCTPFPERLDDGVVGKSPIDPVDGRSPERLARFGERPRCEPPGFKAFALAPGNDALLEWEEAIFNSTYATV